MERAIEQGLGDPKLAHSYLAFDARLCNEIGLRLDSASLAGG